MSAFVLRRASMRTALNQTAVGRLACRAGLSRTARCIAVAVATAGCGADAVPKTPAAQSESAAPVPRISTTISPDTAGRTLAFASGAKAYHVDETDGARGIIRGEVTLNGLLPRDTTVVPDRDSTGCRAFTDETLPLPRGARVARKDSSEHEIGNAVVWLMGVTHGPRDAFQRRVNLVLDDCHLEPRVQIAPIGATLNISNRDDMIVKLKFAELGRASTPRATIGFTDPGQIVPSVAPLATAGLVEIVDENHPWVRGFIAVAPHPFVAVTDADGAFEFEGVPVGEYTLVVWHERLGARVMNVRVEAGVPSLIAVKY